MEIAIQGNHFKDVWGTVASILEGFLFSNSKPSVPLNSNERKQ